MVLASCDMKPGNPPDGSCKVCEDILYENGVINVDCTELVACPDELNNAESNIHKKEKLFQHTCYVGDTEFVNRTGMFRSVAIPASKFDSTCNSEDICASKIVSSIKVKRLH